MKRLRLIFATLTLTFGLMSCEPETPINEGDVMKIELTSNGNWNAWLNNQNEWYEEYQNFDNQYTFQVNGLIGDFHYASAIRCADSINVCPASNSNIKVYMNDNLVLDSTYTHIATGYDGAIASIIIDRQNNNLTFY